MILYYNSGYSGYGFLIWWIIAACVGLLLMLLYGYLFNYFVIQELKSVKKQLRDLNDVLGAGFNKIASNSNPPHQPYQMKNDNGQMGLGGYQNNDRLR